MERWKESSRKDSKKKNEDFKRNLEIISKIIKKESDFTVRQVKKELNFMVKEIKKEPCKCENELSTSNFTEVQHKSRIKKEKVTKTCKKVKKESHRKLSNKVEKETSKKIKKSTQTKKYNICKKSLILKKSRRRKNKTRKKKKGKKESKNISESAKSTHTKKLATTLLDQQSSTRLHLFGFKDELEYFSSESDHEVYNETSSRCHITGKRTRLSSLKAREKVLLTLKSSPKVLFSKPRPVIHPPVSENIDLLGSILESQAMWHSKKFHMKVNEDGSVEVTSRINKDRALEIDLTDSKEINLWERKTNKLVCNQEQNDTGCTQPTAIEPLPHGSLNLNKNLESHLTNMNIKVETLDPAEAWDIETVIDKNEEQTLKEKIKAEGKKEIQDMPIVTTPFSPLQKSPILKWTSCNSPKTEKSSNNEVSDCPIWMRFIPNESDMELIQIKNEKIEGEND